MFPFLPMLIGAGAGALLNKKKPLQGALMGGLLGGAGGQFLPGLLGSGATAGAAGAATGQGVALEAMYGGVAPEVAAGIGATANAGLGAAPIIEKGVALNSLGAEGLKKGGLLGMAKEYAGPAMNVAQSVKAMIPEEQPIQASPLSPAVHNPGPSNFYNSIIEQQNQRQMAELEKRYRRRAGNGIA